MERLREFLASQAEGDLLPWEAQCEASRRLGASLAKVEEAALEWGLMPKRYSRNRDTISIAQQLQLCRSRVAVIGCGGLGGYLIEELARLGVGTLVLADPDVFEEHNLNRQLFSSPARLGRAKVEAARERVAEVNPAVTVVAHRAAFSRENGQSLLSGCSAVVDGLDNIHTRRVLAAISRDLSLPFVHGAIAGWYGQVAVQMPGEDISPLLGPISAEGKGLEANLGNPAFTPAAIASLQVAEVAKILLGRGSLSGRVLFANLLDMEFEVLRYGRSTVGCGE
jgi:molybdopterin/thiamine biosynthesis adenylyltransferase